MPHMDKNTTVPPSVIALIVAAGRGTRLNKDIPKQYLRLAGEPILRHTIKAFINHPSIDTVQVIIHPDDRALYDDAVIGLSLPEPVLGGETRQDSVRLGLESLKGKKPEKILIHDAARPFVSSRLISEVIEGLAEHQAIIPTLPIADTIKRVENKYITATIDRHGLAVAQTPQGFHFDTILSAHKTLQNQTFTDDASLCEAADITVATVLGSCDNIKITTPEDLQRAENIQNSHMIFETRVGNGFDVHRFKEAANPENNYIMLCGIPVSHDKAIEAHSDGDVGLHAIVDALLGSIGTGDIGQHFPPSDPQWEGKDSSHFLSHAASLVANAGARIVNIDVTLICERPKVGVFYEPVP